ncbi:MAG: type II toxin-antitoxin system HicB family antitoxin [bacterium]
MKRLAITEEIWKEGNMYTSYCPELDIATCGHTIEEAKKNLIEIIKIQIEETDKISTLAELLQGA